MLTLSTYILLPTADEIVIHPIRGLFYAHLLNLPLIYGVLLSIVIYRGIGVACLLGALLVGGKPAYYKLREKMRRNQKVEQKPVQAPYG